MPDFSQLARKPAGQATRPPLLPIGNYMGRIKSFEWGESSQKKTPYVRFMIVPVAGGEDVDQTELAGIDLSKKQFRQDFFFTDDILWRLDKFLMTLGLSMDGRSYEEVLPESMGSEVKFALTQKMNQTGTDSFNEIMAISGTVDITE